MLNVTDAAAERLTELIDKNADAPQEAAIRFIRGESGLDVKLDKPAGGDETFDHNGRVVLVMDEQLAAALTDKKLDVSDAQQGLGLKVVDAA